MTRLSFLIEFLIDSDLGPPGAKNGICTDRN